MSKPNLTQKLNQNNVQNVRKQIACKQGYLPFFGTIDNAEAEITDFDHFPYTRFYRGVYNSSDPVVIEREAGWRPRQNQCYQVSECGKQKAPYPNHCWESSCSVTYPCYPGYLAKYTDKAALDVMLNNACIVQYR